MIFKQPDATTNNLIKKAEINEQEIQEGANLLGKGVTAIGDFFKNIGNLGENYNAARSLKPESDKLDLLKRIFDVNRLKSIEKGVAGVDGVNMPSSIPSSGAGIAEKMEAYQSAVNNVKDSKFSPTQVADKFADALSELASAKNDVMARMYSSYSAVLSNDSKNFDIIMSRLRDVNENIFSKNIESLGSKYTQKNPKYIEEFSRLKEEKQIQDSSIQAMADSYRGEITSAQLNTGTVGNNPYNIVIENFDKNFPAGTGFDNIKDSLRSQSAVLFSKIDQDVKPFQQKSQRIISQIDNMNAYTDKVKSGTQLNDLERTDLQSIFSAYTKGNDELAKGIKDWQVNSDLVDQFESQASTFNIEDIGNLRGECQNAIVGIASDSKSPVEHKRLLLAMAKKFKDPQTVVDKLQTPEGVVSLFMATKEVDVGSVRALDAIYDQPLSLGIKDGIILEFPDKPLTFRDLYGDSSTTKNSIKFCLKESAGDAIKIAIKEKSQLLTTYAAKIGEGLDKNPNGNNGTDLLKWVVRGSGLVASAYIAKIAYLWSKGTVEKAQAAIREKEAADGTTNTSNQGLNSPAADGTSATNPSGETTPGMPARTAPMTYDEMMGTGAYANGKSPQTDSTTQINSTPQQVSKPMNNTSANPYNNLKKNYDIKKLQHTDTQHDWGPEWRPSPYDTNFKYPDATSNYKGQHREVIANNERLAQLSLDTDLKSQSLAVEKGSESLSASFKYITSILTSGKQYTENDFISLSKYIEEVVSKNKDVISLFDSVAKVN